MMYNICMIDIIFQALVFNIALTFKFKTFMNIEQLVIILFKTTIKYKFQTIIIAVCNL